MNRDTVECFGNTAGAKVYVYIQVSIIKILVPLVAYNCIPFSLKKKQTKKPQQLLNV